VTIKAEVTISFVLLNLEGIDAVAGTMAVAGYFFVSWRDENLVWTPSDYNDTFDCLLCWSEIVYIVEK
jgi:hypothetical protein